MSRPQLGSAAEWSSPGTSLGESLKGLSSSEAQKLYDPNGAPVSIDLAEAQAQAGDSVAKAFVHAYKRHVSGG